MKSKKTILIVEDDEFLVDAYSLKLGKENYALEIARDGNEALNKLKKQKPDLVILDLVMPNKDGFAVLKEMKANKDWKDIPVIIASNINEPASIKKGLSLGANDYFVKAEISITDLVEKCCKYIPD
jgi:two-component system alkaline phosphatase synthesis response regulator PhoP